MEFIFQRIATSPVDSGLCKSRAGCYRRTFPEQIPHLAYGKSDVKNVSRIDEIIIDSH